ncbi:MAG: methionyl-tRNA formyltransferase [Kiritimatiellae bacterium]|nr:methionyl-tRNA formyltransferase [Kiritimatiellia bacterium]MDW8457550.1 methionyl-tRNA formyltransferase [Verrucomicrobiota bacterium]
MRILFMGSDAFAVPAIEALARSPHLVLACVTQPDRPQGRGRKVKPCPAKDAAERLGIPTLTPERIGDAFEEIAARAPELIVVAAYGQYIPSRLLNLPPKGCINIHPSLLPRYRGAAPIQWAVANGETETGVTIAEVTPKMDAGPILLQQSHPIFPGDTALTLESRLANAGAELMLEAIRLIENGEVRRTPQDEASATWARKLTKEDGRLDWRRPATELHNQIRGFVPWPGSFGSFQGRRIAVLASRAEEGSGAPGEILEASRNGPLVACGQGALRLLSVQPEGKREMSGADWARGARVSPGDRLDVDTSA